MKAKLLKILVLILVICVCFAGCNVIDQNLPNDDADVQQPGGAA